MRYILICIWFFLTDPRSSSAMPTNESDDHYRTIRWSSSDESNNRARVDITPSATDQPSSTGCSLQTIDIDALSNGTSATDEILGYVSSWQRKPQTGESDDESSHPLKSIEIAFTIPYTIAPSSVLNQTVFITDVAHNQLLAALSNLCWNGSSFIVYYASIKALPHNICLYLVLNQSLSTVPREIVFCRTIDDSQNPLSPSSSQEGDGSHTVGPSQFFILSQCIIILIMMFIIFIVQTARQKSLVHRVSQRLSRSRPYKVVFGHKAMAHANGTSTNHTAISSATTLRAGLNQIVFPRQRTASSDDLDGSLDKQDLSAADLTSTVTSRSGARPYGNRDLINVKEFTKRISRVDDFRTDSNINTSRIWLWAVFHTTQLVFQLTQCRCDCQAIVINTKLTTGPIFWQIDQLSGTSADHVKQRKRPVDDMSTSVSRISFNCVQYKDKTESVTRDGRWTSIKGHFHPWS